LFAVAAMWTLVGVNICGVVLDGIASSSANKFCFPNPIKSTDHALSRSKISDIFVRDNLDGNDKER
jgi:hypothetical protein